MANVNTSALHNFVDGETVTEAVLDQNFEVLRVAQNDTFALVSPDLKLNGGVNKITFKSAIPSTGTWARGDIAFNTLPVASGKVGWVCITAGTPGTWKPFGVIDA